MRLRFHTDPAPELITRCNAPPSAQQQGSGHQPAAAATDAAHAATTATFTANTAASVSFVGDDEMPPLHRASCAAPTARATGSESGHEIGSLFRRLAQRRLD